MLHQVGLYFHILAVLLVGAGGIGGAIVEHQFWKYIKMNSPNAKALLPVLKMTGKFIMTGIILFLLSGLTMLYTVQWVFLSQIWFIVKFALFLSLPIRAALIAKPTLMIVGTEFQKEETDPVLLLKLRSKMERFHIIQYGIVLTIIFLVIFKP